MLKKNNQIVRISEGSGSFFISGSIGHENDVIKVYYHKPKNMTSRSKILMVIPVTGFFEPHDRGDVKYPCYIHPKDKTYISLLGCATRFDDMILFTVLTTIANPFGWNP